MGRAIGIDLGTTNSCVAIVGPGGPEVVQHRGGRTLIPSVFAVDKRGRQLVGEDARKQAALNPLNTVIGSKRFIGRQADSDAVRALTEKISYQVTSDDDGDVSVMVQGNRYSLIDVAAILLTRIRESTQETLEEFITDAVVTVPAYFNDNQRNAVRKAGAQAGLNVLRVLNEPTAAALAYGSGKHRTETVAVFDLGGGTFDLSVIRVDGQMFEVLATGGDTMLGGLDFDRRLVELMVRRFYQEQGLDLRKDVAAMARIQEAAESAKINLSNSRSTAVNLPFITRGPAGPINLETTITREDFEGVSRDLVQRTLMTVGAIVREAGLEPKQLDQILLVGGQTRMPLVQNALADFFGRPPAKNVHPDEAVALGAAIMADLLVNGNQSSVTLIDVLPQTIGLGLPDGKFHPVFPKYTPVPATKTLKLTTAFDNQRSLELQVYQGESNQADRNTPLGGFEFDGVRPGPAGSVRVVVSLQLDSQGILNLSAADRDTNQALHTRLKLPPGKQGHAVKADTSKTAPPEQQQQQPMPPVSASQSSPATPGPVRPPAAAPVPQSNAGYGTFSPPPPAVVYPPSLSYPAVPPPTPPRAPAPLLPPPPPLASSVSLDAPVLRTPTWAGPAAIKPPKPDSPPSTNSKPGMVSYDGPMISSEEPNTDDVAEVLGEVAAADEQAAASNSKGKGLFARMFGWLKKS